DAAGAAFLVVASISVGRGELSEGEKYLSASGHAGGGSVLEAARGADGHGGWRAAALGAGGALRPREAPHTPGRGRKGEPTPPGRGSYDTSGAANGRHGMPPCPDIRNPPLHTGHSAGQHCVKSTPTGRRSTHR